MINNGRRVQIAAAGTSCVLMHVGVSSAGAVTQQVHEDWCVERLCQRIVTGRVATMRGLVDSIRVSRERRAWYEQQLRIPQPRRETL